MRDEASGTPFKVTELSRRSSAQFRRKQAVQNNIRLGTPKKAQN